MRGRSVCAAAGFAWLAAACGLLPACSLRSVSFTPEDGRPLDAGPPDSPATAQVTIRRGGAATGVVSAQGLELSCAETCTATVPAGALVTLVATPDPGAVFGGWSGDGCAGTDPTCAITVSGDLAVVAQFDVATFTVDVGMIGNGLGVVTSLPGALACPGTCTTTVPHNTTLELAASPAATSTFLGWGGACSGTGGCSLTVTTDVTVTAAFAANHDLIVMRAGNGGGTVSSTPAGISCGTDCAQSYAPGTVVMLAATASAGSTFTGWSGPCAGTGACQVTMTTGIAVTATFSLITGALVVTNFSAPVGLEVFAAGATGDVAPLRVISGAATTFVNPRGVAVANNEIIVVDQSAQAIDVFPLGATGDVAPIRRIAGAPTLLSTPIGLLVFGGEIYVAQASGTIVVFPLGANGAVPPSRTISGIGGGRHLAISGGEIYSTDATPGRILVFPASASGVAVPTRTIGGPMSGLSGPFGILVHDGEIFVSEPQTNRIRVFAQAASGDIAPLRVIAGASTQLSFPEQMAIFAGELYVSNFSNSSVLMFPVNASGDVAPTRRIFGPLTRLSGPLGAFVF